MPSPRPTILLTGFGPFPGIAENASALLAAKLGRLAASRFRAHRVVAKVLPTEWEAAPARLAAHYAREKPRLALHFGVSERAQGFVIETSARNIRSPTPDARGALPSSASIAAGGPERMAAGVPAEAIVARLTALGLPAHVSDDAGTYLCNAVLYHALAAARPAMTGLVHIPALLAAEGGGTSGPAARSLLDWETAVSGGLEIIRVCLGRPAPARLKRL